MAGRMTELARSYPHPQPELTRRALAQAARELLLAQSSDWAFIMKAGTCIDYAKKRFETHTAHFLGLYDDIKSSNIDPEWLSELEEQSNLFPNIDYMVYAGRATM